MSSQQFILGDDDSDWRIFENIKEQRVDTHIPLDAADGALAVTVNTGTLGAGGDALSIAPGPAVVNDTRYDIAATTADVALGDSRPRRDVVYVTDTGTIDVVRGTPATLAWGEGIIETQQSMANAFLPAPRAFGSVEGLPLAVVTVPGNNATALVESEGTLRDVRVRKPAFGDDIDEAFADGDFGYRRLSEFGSLQAAVDWSWDNIAAVYVDGDHTFDEAGVDVHNRAILVGDREGSSITTTDSSSTPLFRYGAESGCTPQWSGVRFNNDGGAKRAFVPHENFTAMQANTRMADLVFDGFGGGSYTVELRDAYAGEFANIHVRNKFTQSNGSIHVHNCNASRFDSLKSTWEQPADGESPCIYITQCVATPFVALHAEAMSTDAAVQVHEGTPTLVAPHIEANPALDVDGANCGIQLGDGGLSTGNTGGGSSTGRFEVVHGTSHGLVKSGAEDYRILNTQQTMLSGDEEAMSVNYGGSNNHSQSALDVSPGSVLIRGNDQVDITNSVSSPAPILIQNGRVFAGKSEAEAGMIPYESARIDAANAWGWAWMDGSGALHQWRSDDTPTPTAQRTSASSIDINQSTPTTIPWDTQITGSSTISHDGGTITFEESGRYAVTAAVSMTANDDSQRTGPAVWMTLNGGELDGTRTYSYIRNMEGLADESVRTGRVVDVDAGETMEIRSIQSAAEGDVGLNANESLLLIKCIGGQ